MAVAAPPLWLTPSAFRRRPLCLLSHVEAWATSAPDRLTQFYYPDGEDGLKQAYSYAVTAFTLVTLNEGASLWPCI